MFLDHENKNYKSKEEKNKEGNKKTGEIRKQPVSLIQLKKFVRGQEEKNQGLADYLSQLFVQMKENLNFTTLFFPVILIYLEVILHLFIYSNITRYSLFVFLFAIPIGIFLTFLCGLFKKEVNIVLAWIFTSISCLLFIVQLIYFNIFKAYLSMYSIGAVGTDVLEFSDQIILGIKDNLLGIILCMLPLLTMGIMNKKLIFNKKNRKHQFVLLASAIILQLVSILLLPIYGKGSYSPYDLYHKTWVQEMSVERLGLLTTTKNDFARLITMGEGNSLDGIGKLPIVEGQEPDKEDSTTTPTKDEDKNPVKEPTATPTPDPEPIPTEPNILDIDFAALAENEKNAELKVMHQYFNQVQPTLKNEYTGMFEGYNLIHLVAEGYSPYAVHKEVTPTLYKLVNEGFVFNNFYTPLWWASTSDGEYVANTSLIPKSGVVSFYESGSNYMPFAFGNQFGKLGYSTRAYHNHTYTYYKRHISHPNMGYEYKGLGNGLEVTETWPESDLEMMELTIPEYINDQPFHTYYMTVSGHMNYTFTGNSMSAKNKELVEDLPYSEESKAYIACNVELDRALEKLLADLEAQGIADKTVIALSADHYPYGLEKDKIDELAGHKVEENFELYKNNFILWSGSMKEPIVIDKVSSSLDIAPTLSNLFGLEYDSRLFMGRDILSDAEPLVMFSNRSFITDKVMYNSKTQEVINLTEEEIPEDYINNLNQIVDYKFLISENILDLDYYNKIGID